MGLRFNFQLVTDVVSCVLEFVLALLWVITAIEVSDNERKGIDDRK